MNSTTHGTMVTWKCNDCLSFGCCSDGNDAAAQAVEHAADFGHTVVRGGFRVTEATGVAERGYGRKDGTPFATLDEAIGWIADMKGRGLDIGPATVEAVAR
jgi:hypothetical protein